MRYQPQAPLYAALVAGFLGGCENNNGGPVVPSPLEAAVHASAKVEEEKLDLSTPEKAVRAFLQSYANFDYNSLILSTTGHYRAELEKLGKMKFEEQMQISPPRDFKLPLDIKISHLNNINKRAIEVIFGLDGKRRTEVVRLENDVWKVCVSDTSQYRAYYGLESPEEAIDELMGAYMYGNYDRALASATEQFKSKLEELGEEGFGEWIAKKRDIELNISERDGRIIVEFDKKDNIDAKTIKLVYKVNGVEKNNILKLEEKGWKVAK